MYEYLYSYHSTRYMHCGSACSKTDALPIGRILTFLLPELSGKYCIRRYKHFKHFVFNICSTRNPQLQQVQLLGQYTSYKCCTKYEVRSYEYQQTGYTVRVRSRSTRTSAAPQSRRDTCDLNTILLQSSTSTLPLRYCAPYCLHDTLHVREVVKI